MTASKSESTRLPYTAAVIAAAGSASRFGSDKLMADLGGMPVLARTLTVFERMEAISEIVIAAREDSIEEINALCARYAITKLRRVVPGGDVRSRSCLAGVMGVSSAAELIAVQDGARPLVTEKIITDALWTAFRHGAAVPAVPVRDTVKTAENGVVIATLDRSRLYAVQTPQCFRADLIRKALERAVELAPDVTDDCLAVERLGEKVFLSCGSEENMKITTPLDLHFAALILAERREHESRPRL